MHFFTEKGGKSLVLLLFGVVVFCSQTVLSADLYFTNVLGGNFTNKTLWMTGVVPTNSDNANFTNNTARQIDFTINATNANAFFNSSLGSTYTQNIGSATWYVTNQYMLGQNTGMTGTVTQISGTLVVTNAGRTASIVIGNSGGGTFNLEGGTVIADSFYVTNLTSALNIDAGTLTIKNGSIISNISGAVVKIGNVAGQLATVNYNGGANKIGRDTILGTVAGSTGVVNVTGSSTYLTNISDFTIGSNSAFNSMTVSGGAVFFNLGGELNLGYLASSVSNTFTVDGGVVTNAGGGLWIGYNSSGNSVYITNGGNYVNTGGSFGLLVGGAGTGGVTSNNTIIISSGSHMKTVHTTLIGGDGATNVMIVTGSGTLFEGAINMSLGQGSTARDNRIEVRNGAVLSNISLTLGKSGGDDNILLVTGAGSVNTNTAFLLIGGSSAFDNFVLVSNGGALYADVITLSSNFSSVGNKLHVSGLGSIASAQVIASGSNSDIGSSLGSGFIQVDDRATLEIRGTITNGFAGLGNISNVGGIYQFTTASPTIVTNAGGTIVLSNGWVAYRDVQNAPVLLTNQLSKFEFTGTNSFILNNSTNAIFKNYTFTNGFGSTNWMNLTLMNGASRWQATNTLIGATSTMLITNSLATIFGTTTNSGAINILDGSVGKFEGALAGSGTINVDATSAIIFSNSSGTVTISGVISGGGSLTHMGGDTLILSANNTFTGPLTNISGTLQLNSVTGLGFTTSVILNGGTLLFNQNLTNTSAAVTLSGGTIQETDTNVSLGALTVAANSTVQLGSGGGIGRLRFASGTNTVGSGAKLTVYGWSWNSGLTGGSDDLIFFTSTSFETASFLDNVTFFGTGGGARVLSSGELVPITPEPNTIWAATVLISLGLRQLRKRLIKTCPP